MVKDLTADGVDNALRNLSPGMQITGGHDPRRPHRDGPAGGDDGHRHPGRPDHHRHPRPGPEPIALDNVTVDAVTVGVESQPGSAVTLRNSSVHALEAVRGNVTLLGINDLSLPPLNLLGAIGLPLIILAVVLEVAAPPASRRFGPTRRLPPPLPVGAG